MEGDAAALGHTLDYSGRGKSLHMCAKYCSACGSRLVGKWFEFERRFRNACDRCNSVHYENPRVLVWCYVYWSDKVVFCRRANAPAIGRWTLPGGFVEKCETLEAAVIREVREETGIDLNLPGVLLFRVTSLPHMNEVYVEFRSRLLAAPALMPGPETLEVEGFTQENVPRDELAFADMIPNYPDEFYECISANKFPIRSITVRAGEPL